MHLGELGDPRVTWHPAWNDAVLPSRPQLSGALMHGAWAAGQAVGCCQPHTAAARFEAIDGQQQQAERSTVKDATSSWAVQDKCTAPAQAKGRFGHCSACNPRCCTQCRYALHAIMGSSRHAFQPWRVSPGVRRSLIQDRRPYQDRGLRHLWLS
jgi:hypothetical protein